MLSCVVEYRAPKGPASKKQTPTLWSNLSTYHDFLHKLYSTPKTKTNDIGGKVVFGGREQLRSHRSSRERERGPCEHRTLARTPSISPPAFVLPRNSGEGSRVHDLTKQDTVAKIA